MATVELSAKERRRLEDTFRTTTDRRLRDRVQAVLMASGDRTQAQIAADLLVSCYRARELRSRDPLSRRLIDGAVVATATMAFIDLPVRSPLAAM